MLRSRVEDTPPEAWYRQFWPWFLIILPGTVVVASIATMIVAFRGSDDLVVDEYYKDGLAINRQLEREELARSRGYGADIRLSEDRVVVQTQNIPAVAQLHLRLSHPMEADRDISMVLLRSGQETYEASLPVAIGNNWHWLLDGGDESPWRITGITGRAPDEKQRASSR